MTTIATQLPAMVPAFGPKGSQSTDSDSPLWTAAILWAHQNHEGDAKPSKQAESGENKILPSTLPLITSLPFAEKDLLESGGLSTHLAAVNIANIADNKTYLLTTVSQDSLKNKSSSVQNLQLEVCGTKELLHVDVMELHLSGCVVRMTVETSDHDQVIRTEKLNSIVSQLCSLNQENHQRENSGDVTTQSVNSANSLSLTSDPELQQSPLNMHVEWHKDELKVWIGFNQQDAKVMAAAEQLLRWIALHFPLTSIVCNGKEISFDGGNTSGHSNQDFAKALKQTFTSHHPEIQNNFSFQYGALYAD